VEGGSCSTNEQMRNICKILVGNPAYKRLLACYERRFEENTKIRVDGKII
jgi:hypothetical protein